MNTSLEKNGFSVADSLISENKLNQLTKVLTENYSSSTRHLLSNRFVRNLSHDLKALVEPLKYLMPVQATYFLKSEAHNWFVAAHRDLTIPVAHHHTLDGWHRPTIKESIPFIQAPRALLSQCIALRVQLDTTNEGGLTLYSGSHISDAEGQPTTPMLSRGSALLMQPLVKHSSNKVKTVGTKRRVVHILYGPHKLPEPFKWNSFAA